MPRASLPTMTVSSRSTASLAVARLSRSWKAARWTSAWVKVARVAVTRSTSAAARSSGVVPARGGSSRSPAWRWTCGGSGGGAPGAREGPPEGGLGVRLAVLAEGLAEAGGELRAAQVAVDLGERDVAAAVGDDQAGAALGRFEAEGEVREGGFELHPVGGPGEDRAGLLADAVSQELDAGAHGLAVGAGAEVGRRLFAAGADQVVVDLDAGDGFVGLRHVAEGAPGEAVVADAVDDDVDVLLLGVAVGDEDRLVVGEAHGGEDPAGGVLPLLAGEVLALGQAEAEVVDGLSDPRVLAGRVAHQLGRLGGVLGVEVAGAGPRDAGGVGVVARSPLEVADEAGEAAAESGPVSGRGSAAALEGGHPRGSTWRARRTRRTSARTCCTTA